MQDKIRALKTIDKFIIYISYISYRVIFIFLSKRASREVSLEVSLEG